MTNNNYEAPEAELASAEPEYEYVGFWLRLAASLLDNIFLSIAIIPLLFLLVGFDDLAAGGSGGVIGALIMYVLPIILIVAFWVTTGATPGKMVCKAKIVSIKTGENPTVGQSIIRYIGYIVGAIPLMLGFIWVAFDKKKQGWHDKMAGVVVVKN